MTKPATSGKRAAALALLLVATGIAITLAIVSSWRKDQHPVNTTKDACTAMSENVEGLRLELSAERRADGGVRIALNLINQRSTGVHLAAGLPDPWSPGNKRDDEPAYRFIDDDRLVVVVGDPWLPEHGVTMRLFNHLFIVPPKDELLHEFDLPGPIEEYNAYFPQEPESSHSSRGRLVLKVLVREGAAGFEPSPLYSNAVIAEHLGEARWISASCDIDVDVLKSASDDFERPSKGDFGG